MGEYVLDKNGKKILKDITQYDELSERLFDLEKVEKLEKKDATFNKLTLALNKTFQKYEINSCLRKIHFIAQAYSETQRFLLTYEVNPRSNLNGGVFYRGRGLLQLTHDYNYRDFYINTYKKKPTSEELKKFAPKVAKSIDLACLSAGWYWNKEGIYKYADMDNATKVSAAINYPKALNDENLESGINHLSDRKLYNNLLKRVFDYENCKHKK